MGYEYIAWKGSVDVYVYSCDSYPSPPEEIIYYGKRIETVEDFDDALAHGKRMKATYCEVGTGAFGD